MAVTRLYFPHTSRNLWFLGLFVFFFFYKNQQKMFLTPSLAQTLPHWANKPSLSYVNYFLN